MGGPDIAPYPPNARSTPAKPWRSTILGRMLGWGGAAMPGERNGIVPGVRTSPVSERPRWYGHPYNRAGLYRLAEALGWGARGLRVGPASRGAGGGPPVSLGR